MVNQISVFAKQLRTAAAALEAIGIVVNPGNENPDTANKIGRRLRLTAVRPKTATRTRKAMKWTPERRAKMEAYWAKRKKGAK